MGGCCHLIWWRWVADKNENPLCTLPSSPSQNWISPKCSLHRGNYTIHFRQSRIHKHNIYLAFSKIKGQQNNLDFFFFPLGCLGIFFSKRKSLRPSTEEKQFGKFWNNTIEICVFHPGRSSHGRQLHKLCAFPWQ